MSEPSPKILVAVLAFNEGDKLRQLVMRFPDDRNYEVLFVDDGSSDGTAAFLDKSPFAVIHHTENLGVGAGISSAVKHAREHGHELLVVMAANGKMLPEEIPRLLEPLISNQADYVQGSRYLKGGQAPNLPLFRRFMIKLFTLIVNLFTGIKGTDITCGFRAYRLAILNHPEVDINQDWLGKYEMEYYIHYKVIKLGYRLVEVPVSMVYPAEGKNYSKITPFVGWWSMIRPWIFLILHLKK